MPPIAAKDDERPKRMLEKTIDQIEEDVLSYEVSDEAVEAAGTRAEIAGVAGRLFAAVFSAGTKTRARRRAPSSPRTSGLTEFAAST
jgi:hypothetical protein